MTEKLLPFKIVEECKNCDDALKGFNNIADSQQINDVEVYLRRDGDGKGWHISGFKIDGYTHDT